jgi:hypothetical protein
MLSLLKLQDKYPGLKNLPLSGLWQGSVPCGLQAITEGLFTWPILAPPNTEHRE